MRAARAIVREETPVKRIRPTDEHDMMGGRSVVVSRGGIMFLYIQLRSEPDEIRSIAPTTAIDEHKKDCKKDEDRALSLPAR